MHKKPAHYRGISILGVLFSAFVYCRGNMVQITTCKIIVNLDCIQLEQIIYYPWDQHYELIHLLDHNFHSLIETSLQVL